MGTTITGCGTAVPVREVGNEELCGALGLSDGWIYPRTGIRSRRIAKAQETTSVLTIHAARQALERAKVDPQEIDTVILATVTPDHLFPATACLVQSELGASNAAAFDLNAGCSGFLFALIQATALIDSGMSRSVLVCGADVLSHLTRESDPKTAILFGDGAGAVVVQRSDAPGWLGPFVWGADGSKQELLFALPEERTIKMEGREVFRHAVREMSQAVQHLAVEAGLSLEDVDLVLAHQANARILDAVADNLKLRPDQVFNNIERLGNTSNASIPIALDEAVQSGRLAEGNTAVLVAFGAGFTWAAGFIRWGSLPDQHLATAAGAPGYV